MDNNFKKTIIPTGIPQLDEKLGGGLKTSEVTAIAGRPSMEKTAFAISMLKDMVMPAAFFSMEISNKQIMRRINRGDRKFSFSKLEDSEQSKNMIKVLFNTPKYFDDTVGSALDWKRKIHYLVDDYNVKCVIFDYFQLITKQNHEQILGSLQNLANELDVAIILLLQIQRLISQNPQLSDCLQSSSMPVDCISFIDNLLFLNRPAYYDDSVNENLLEIGIKRLGGSTARGKVSISLF